MAVRGYRPTTEVVDVGGLLEVECLLDVGGLLEIECLLEVSLSTVADNCLPVIVVNVNWMWVGWGSWQNRWAVVGSG